MSWDNIPANLALNVAKLTAFGNALGMQTLANASKTQTQTQTEKKIDVRNHDVKVHSAVAQSAVRVEVVTPSGNLDGQVYMCACMYVCFRF